MKRPRRWNPIVVVARLLSMRQHEERCDAPTIVRLLTSRHLDDLQLAAVLALSVAAVDLIPIFKKILIPLYNSGEFSERSPTLLLTVFGAMMLVLSWAYKSGSKRLGAIDMVATEISAICKVCWVTEFPDVSLHHHDTFKRDSSPPVAMPFTSQEEYAPFLNHGTSDIQALSFEVIKSITSFYTFRKTMMDMLRKMYAVHTNKEREGVCLMMIYNQFLMYESARYAILNLMEFECERAEALINILCCEMRLYPFLVKTFKVQINGRDDVRYQRLMLRRPEYDEFVDDIRASAEKHGGGAEWQRAVASMDALNDNYIALQNAFRAKPVVVAGTAAE